MVRHEAATGERRFRVRDMDTDEEWICDKLAGKAQSINGGCERYKMHLRGTFVFSNGVAAFYPPTDYAEPEYIPVKVLPASHYRVCVNKGIGAEAGLPDFRLQDERLPKTHPERLRYVNGYEGLMNLNRFDDDRHLFHDGEIAIDTEEVAHFVA